MQSTIEADIHHTSITPPPYIGQSADGWPPLIASSTLLLSDFQLVNPSIRSYQSEQVAAEEAQRAAQQDAAHADMVWETISGLIRRDNVPVDTPIQQNLADQLGIHDPVVHGLDDAVPKSQQWLHPRDSPT
ncbi:hypothetical protein PCASD_06313 [Puccinia coronata f. sp. avenae]|uniref:Uncharacterized protein n=1 Tax=Puccinia coronata f. sp. avenae TaxID=200324 RepID=A0A2N5V9A6_9BASI|nr:hypothetical protein PCASD_06313 [Puccinia coronata f. sp. avenae]